MESNDQISAESAWLHRLFSPGPARVSLTGGTIHFEERLGDIWAKISVGTIGSITVRPAWFWHRLTIRLTDGTERSIGGLDGREASLIRDAGLEEAARIHEAAVAEAVRSAKAVSPRLTRLDEELRQLFAGNRYARYHDSLKLHEAVAPALRECEGLIREHLEQEAREALGRLECLELVESFEAARRKANGLFVSNQAPSVQAAALTAVPNPLTNEQAESVATDEDVTLVLAGAGTGKTSVVVGKVAHLVRNQGVSPDDILVLAFNKDAVAEIKGRLPGELSTAHVRTFHSFGSRVIAEVEGGAPNVAEFAKESKLSGTLKCILNELLDDPQESDATANFIASYHGAYKSAFDFHTRDEYNAYIRSVELRTLSDVRVKSFEELEIANFLTKHGVKFCYERPYEVWTQTGEYRQYRPDFYLPDYDIYIEHHALDELGNPPRGWEGYKERVEWHRRTHRKYGTKLIETYSWQHRWGILLDKLGERLEREGVRLERVSQRELVLGLARQLIEWLARLMAKFLNHAKTNGLSPEELRARASERGTLWRNEGFLEVFEQVRTRYEQRLGAEGKLDYHDLINRAAHYIREGKWETHYRYVLVDEFQDISAGRMKLLQALRRDDTAYFLVGDDWQSINRFAGSDVGLLRNCGDYLGHVRTRTLSKTFRFGDGILGPSTEFVLSNPEQWKRTLTSASVTVDRGITVIYADDPAAGLQRAREDIQTSPRGNSHSVLVLGRYRSSEKALQGKTTSEEFSTVHGAKGREADYVVVLDLKDGRWGFPSRIEGNSLLELVLPPVSGGAYPFAEERRLFYVAMTRARIGAFLITDPEWPSTFVTELLQQSGNLRQLGARAPECPRCHRGRLRVMNGSRGQFWGCTEYWSEPSCGYKNDVETADEPGGGFCIRCKAVLPADLERPYCQRCYRNWNKDETYEEKYCHMCGHEHIATLRKPLCVACQLF